MTATTSDAIASATTSAKISPDEVINRVCARLIPFLCILFIVNYLDRTNISMAKLQMLADTKLSEFTYGLGAGLFFWGYFLLEVPSNMILERVGARLWIARIMLTWGVISGSMMFVRGPMSFYALRFALGAAEAGFFPGIVLYLTYWIPSSRRAGVLAMFLTSTAVSGILGNPLAGLLMKLENVGGLHGWQWLFMLEGIVPVILGFVTFALLPDKPIHAKWLSDEDRATLALALEREHEEQHPQHHVADFTRALAGVRLWHLSVIYFLLIMGLYGFIYWAPTILKSVATGKSDLQIGFISAIPYIVAAITMLLIGRHADRKNERRWHVATCAIIAASGVAILTRCHTLPTVLATMCFATIGIFGSLGPFWALATRDPRGTAAAGGIAIVNSIGALAGFVAPSAIGWAKTSTGSFAAGLLLVSASLISGAVSVLLVPRAIDRNQ